MAVFALLENGGEVKKPRDDIVLHGFILRVLLAQLDEALDFPISYRPELIYRNARYFLNAHRLTALNSGGFEYEYER